MPTTIDQLVWAGFALLLSLVAGFAKKWAADQEKLIDKLHNRFDAEVKRIDAEARNDRNAQRDHLQSLSARMDVVQATYATKDLLQSTVERIRTDMLQQFRELRGELPGIVEGAIYKHTPPHEQRSP